jgi:hypothetical protein
MRPERRLYGAGARQSALMGLVGKNSIPGGLGRPPWCTRSAEGAMEKYGGNGAMSCRRGCNLVFDFDLLPGGYH